MTIFVADFFDEEFYGLTSEALAAGMVPLEHYLKFGEALGYAPSSRFDPKFYAQMNPDVVEFGSSLLLHYVNFGHAEGRLPVSAVDQMVCLSNNIDPARRTIFVIVHEATRTGAPVLAWNLICGFRQSQNVVTLLLKGGPLEEDFQNASCQLVKLPSGLSYGDEQTRAIIRKMAEFYKPAYAIANSVATRDIAFVLEELDIPVIALVHEFSSDFQPVGTLHGLFVSASRVVFPAPIVAAASEADYISLRSRSFEIAPQGPSKVPSLNKSVIENSSDSNVKLSQIGNNAFLVIGMGTITFRKGVDLFISVAADLLRKNPDFDFKFVWIGHVFSFDLGYKVYLQQQIERSGLDGHVILMDEVSDLNPFFERANAFLLSSRLDPLPNVSIDAALHGIPIVTFDRASGMAEILCEDEATRELVVPYLDVGAAAGVIARLYSDRDYRAKTSEALQKKAKSTFDMDRYVATLQALGQACLDDRQQREKDRVVIEAQGVFQKHFCFGPNPSEHGIPDPISRYLQQARLGRPLDRARSGLFFRRPMAGFNPLIYASDNQDYRNSNEDALAHFLRSGRPAGRWSHTVINPCEVAQPLPKHDLKVALHGHFHYPDLLPEFLERLGRNQVKPFLYLTTTADDKADEIQRILAQAQVKNVEVAVVSNRGRDIGPFLEKFGTHGNAYDVIGHIHGKKSTHVDSKIGDQWREFTLDHLLGGEHAMADMILSKFAEDKNLGLVFPEDPHLNDWDENRSLADGLATRMQLSMPLPTHFDFPIGTMFWARPAALKSMFDLNLSNDDYPPEPLPIDGTILHTLERLIPFSAEKAGYRYGTTHVPGSLR